MIGIINRYEIYEADHSKFGGIIYPSDFNTDYRGNSKSNSSTIAQRIARDWIFDMQCRKNLENRNRNKR